MKLQTRLTDSIGFVLMVIACLLIVGILAYMVMG